MTTPELESALVDSIEMLGDYQDSIFNTTWLAVADVIRGLRERDATIARLNKEIALLDNIVALQRNKEITLLDNIVELQRRSK